MQHACKTSNAKIIFQVKYIHMHAKCITCMNKFQVKYVDAKYVSNSNNDTSTNSYHDTSTW
jgi:hypothetical protein